MKYQLQAQAEKMLQQQQQPSASGMGAGFTTGSDNFTASSNTGEPSSYNLCAATVASTIHSTVANQIHSSKSLWTGNESYMTGGSITATSSSLGSIKDALASQPLPASSPKVYNKNKSLVSKLHRMDDPQPTVEEQSFYDSVRRLSQTTPPLITQPSHTQPNFHPPLMTQASQSNNFHPPTTLDSAMALVSLQQSIVPVSNSSKDCQIADSPSSGSAVTMERQHSVEEVDRNTMNSTNRWLDKLNSSTGHTTPPTVPGGSSNSNSNSNDSNNNNNNINNNVNNNNNNDSNRSNAFVDPIRFNNQSVTSDVNRYYNTSSSKFDNAYKFNDSCKFSVNKLSESMNNKYIDTSSNIAEVNNNKLEPNNRYDLSKYDNDQSYKFPDPVKYNEPGKSSDRIQFHIGASTSGEKGQRSPAISVSSKGSSSFNSEDEDTQQQPVDERVTFNEHRRRTHLSAEQV